VLLGFNQRDFNASIRLALDIQAKPGSRNVIMLDDTTAKLAKHHSKRVLVKSFEGNPWNDEPKVLLKFLEKLATVETNRKVDKHYGQNFV
jgi:hypothetical protein